MAERAALITGGSSGIGLAIARLLGSEGYGLTVSARRPEKLEQAVEGLRGEGLDVEGVPANMVNEEDIVGLAERHRERFGRLDVLVNNAGVYLEDDVRGPLGLEDEVLRRTLEVNLHGPLRTCRAFVPGMVERGYGRVVNVSSDCGSIAHMRPGGCTAAYRVSKAALNALTRLIAGEAAASPNVKVNATCPGWVSTHMGLAEGNPTRTPEQGADMAVWLATLLEDGPTDGFFQDRRPLPW